MSGGAVSATVAFPIPVTPPTRESVAADVKSAHERGQYSEARDLDRFGSLAVMLLDFSRRHEIRLRALWEEQANAGFRQAERGYTITERGLGYVVATLDDGTARTIYAPPPFA